MGCVANYVAVPQPQRKWRYLQIRLVLHTIPRRPGGSILKMTASRMRVRGLLQPGCQTRRCLLLAWKTGSLDTVKNCVFSFGEVSPYPFNIAKMYKKEEEQFQVLSECGWS